MNNKSALGAVAPSALFVSKKEISDTEGKAYNRQGNKHRHKHHLNGIEIGSRLLCQRRARLPGLGVSSDTGHIRNSSAVINIGDLFLLFLF